jgi:2-phosphoglycerate kinase
MRVILIGGSSHTGKSTTAQVLAAKLGWSARTTDHLARHPGRPWKTKLRDIPPHVDEHYSTLPTDELFIDVLKHYYRLWPEIKSIITTHATDVTTDPLVLEGSALWPENVATLDLENVKAIWFTASDDLFRVRMYAESGYEGASPHERMLIDKFLDRTILYNQKMMAAVRELGLRSLELKEQDTPDELANRVLELFHAR